MTTEKLQNKIIEEFGSRVTQESYLKKADKGLWESEKKLIEKHFKSGSTVLDVGCGTGRTTIPLHNLGYKVLGIDLVPEMIENAKKIVEEKELKIDYEVGDATNLKYEDNFFDGIYSSAEVGYNKNDKRFYEFVSQNLQEKENIAPEEIIFWDDDQKNVDVANSCGWNAFLYISLEEFQAKMKILF